MTRLSTAEIAEIRERVNAATAGPWTWGLCGSAWVETSPGAPDHGSTSIADFPVDEYHPHAPQQKCNAEFIAAARTDVPRLLSHVSALEEENARLRERAEELETQLAAQDRRIVNQRQEIKNRISEVETLSSSLELYRKELGGYAGLWRIKSLKAALQMYAGREIDKCLRVMDESTKATALTPEEFEHYLKALQQEPSTISTALSETPQ